MRESLGSVITNVAPSPSVLSTVSVPPWPCVTMSYESDRPSPVPVPVGFVVKNGSKIFSWIAAGEVAELGEGVSVVGSCFDVGRKVRRPSKVLFSPR